MQELWVLGVWVRKHMKLDCELGLSFGAALVSQCCQNNIGRTGAVAESYGERAKSYGERYVLLKSKINQS